MLFTSWVEYHGLTLGVSEVLQDDCTACSKVQGSQHDKRPHNAGVAIFWPQYFSLGRERKKHLKWFETEADNSVQSQNDTAL